MKRIFTAILIIIAVKASAQQSKTYYQAAPPKTVSYPETKRADTTGGVVDSLRNHYGSYNGAFSLFPTMAQINKHFNQGLSLQNGFIGIGGTFNAPMNISGNINTSGTSSAFKVVANVTATANNTVGGIITATGTFIPNTFTGGILYGFYSPSSLPNAFNGSLGLGGKLFVNNIQANFAPLVPGFSPLAFIDSTGVKKGQMNNKGGWQFGGSYSSESTDFTIAQNIKLPSVTAGTPLSPLAVDAAGNLIKYTPSASSLTPTLVKTSLYNAAANDYVPCDNTGGSFTVNLPNAPTDKTLVGVKMIKQSGTNTISISASGSDVFNISGGSTTLTLKLLFQGVLLQYSASAGIWYVYSDDLSLGSLDSRYVLVGGGSTVGGTGITINPSNPTTGGLFVNYSPYSGFYGAENYQLTISGDSRKVTTSLNGSAAYNTSGVDIYDQNWYTDPNKVLISGSDTVQYQSGLRSTVTPVWGNDVTRLSDFNSLATIAALQAYTGPLRSIVVTDTLQGGRFNYVATGLTLDSAFVFPATGVGSGYWQRQYQNNGSYSADFWGIARDSSNCSVKMQQAIDFIGRSSAGRGTLQLHSPGKYTASVNIRSGVEIRGDHQNVEFTGNAINQKHSVVWTIPSGSTYCIGTLAAPGGAVKCAVSTAFVRGITFQGLGYSASTQRGIDMISWRKGEISDCSFINFADEAIWHRKPVSGSASGAMTFERLWILAVCLDTVTVNSSIRPGGRYKAAVDIGGNDDNLHNALISPLSPYAPGPSWAPTGNGNIYALHVTGSNFKVEDVEVQFADYGLVLDSTATLCMFNNINSDATSRGSLLIRNASNNTIGDFQSSRPSQEANNTYPAVSSVSNSIRNVVGVISLSTTGGNGNLCNYVIQETLSNSNAYDKNIFRGVSAASNTYATDRFNASGVNASYVQGNENTRVDGTATPDVSGYNYIIANTGTTITSLTGGTPGQWVEIHFTVATQITSGGGITLKAGTTTFPINSSVRLRNYLGTWYEATSSLIAGATGITGTPGKLVYDTSPTITGANLGTPSAITLTNATGLPNSAIAVNTITLGKLANQVNNTLVGNVSGSTASPLAITSSQVLTMLGISKTQATLSSGTVAITITGMTTASSATVSEQSGSGNSLTVRYKAVCTANTLTITALTAADATNTSDNSVVNYISIN